MELTELAKDGGSRRALLDILAQIIELYKKNEDSPSFVLRPENFTVATAKESIDGDENYFDVSYKMNLPFDDTFFAVPKCEKSDEKDAVFCMGMIMYTLAAGDIPDPKKAEELAEFIEDSEDSFRFLTYEKLYGESCGGEDKLLWDIISECTELNRELRPDLNTVMKMIISAYPSQAKIKITENTLHECIAEEIINAETAYNTWESKKIYEYGGERYVPERLDFRLEIPYRLFTKEYICNVSPDKSPEPERIPVKRLSGKHNIGIDFGTWNSSVSFINENGCSEDIFPGDGSVPTAIYYISENECLFGSEALMRSPEAVSRCFKRNVETGDLIRIKAENGDIIEETYYNSAVKYLRFLYTKAQEKFQLDSENSKIVLTLPACYDAGMKTLLLTAAREAGFEPDILTEPEAAAFFFGMRNSSGGNALVFDVGGGTTDISFINFSDTQDGTRVVSESIDGIGRLGGADLTQKLYDELIKSPAVRSLVNMSSEKEPGLEKDAFGENAAIIRNAAEELKIMLSCDNKAVCDVNINVPEKNEKQRVTLSVKRRPYEILIKEEVSKLKARIKKAVSDCGVNINEIKNVIVTGGASLTPSIRNMVISMFSEYECKIHYINYPTAVSRGAAVYANYLAEKNTEKQCISELTYDLGILTVGAYGERPMFKCLARAGTSLRDGGITVTAVCNPTDDEKAKNYCRLFLYRRPKEYSFVESTFDPEGDVICPVGSLYISDFPNGFSLSEGKVQFNISFDTQECISASAAFYMPDGGGNYILKGSCTAVFMPYSAK
ncbi:MAG: Hsp70 family protein [Ruminococcus sp.]|nr:Hsp70 family protein [Ruminococcus sp.]